MAQELFFVRFWKVVAVAALDAHDVFVTVVVLVTVLDLTDLAVPGVAHAVVDVDFIVVGVPASVVGAVGVDEACSVGVTDDEVFVVVTFVGLGSG